jgi:hypothetical protein
VSTEKVDTIYGLIYSVAVLQEGHKVSVSGEVIQRFVVTGHVDIEVISTTWEILEEKG